MRRPDGTEVHDVHLEDVILVPESVRSLESKEPLAFEEEDSIDFQREDLRRSPGMMLEDDGRAVQEADGALRGRPAKFQKLTSGAYIAYALAIATRASGKVCSVGKILSVSSRIASFKNQLF